MCHTGELSCHGKLVRVVLENRGPLSPREVAMEGHMSIDAAREALEEMVELGYVTSVCGICETHEEVYELTEHGREQGPPTVN